MIIKNILILLLLCVVTSCRSPQPDFSHLANEPSDIKDCFNKDDPFVYCLFLAKKRGWIVIDNKGVEPYQIFMFDNGPDYPEEGLFRIRNADKIGYADEITGEVVIEPQYDCALPFKDGTAEVGFNCQKRSDGEHWSWQSGNWHHIDKHGNPVK